MQRTDLSRLRQEYENVCRKEDGIDPTGWTRTGRVTKPSAGTGEGARALVLRGESYCSLDSMRALFSSDMGRKVALTGDRGSLCLPGGRLGKSWGWNMMRVAWGAPDLTPFQADPLCKNLGFWASAGHKVTRFPAGRHPPYPWRTLDTLWNLTGPVSPSTILCSSGEAPWAQGPSFPTQYTLFAILIGSDLAAGNAMAFSNRPGLAPSVSKLP